MDQSNFFFCYNPKLSAFLKYKGINYITKAINPKNNLIFSMYYKNDELQRALDQYKALNAEN